MLPIINDQLSMTNYQLPIINYQLPITNYQLSVHLKKAVRDAERNQKPVAEEQRDLLLEYAFLVSPQYAYMV